MYESTTTKSKTSIFDNTYHRLPERFYHNCRPVPVAAPELQAFNSSFAQQLGFDSLKIPEKEHAAVFSGNILVAGSQPLAMAYAGHQFGSFVPRLGDGRAHLLGEVIDCNGKRFYVQLKGSGRTNYSRGGDGRSALGPVVREYIISEAMNNLGIPTTRALAMVTTGEEVLRQNGLLPGGILTRVASGLVRIGTFEYFAAQNDKEALKTLADYVIARHFPLAAQTLSPYLSLFEMVAEQQAKLVAQWMLAGFIHGVMNTDNTSISCETIDYGPCAFLDHYNPDQVFSSIDFQGRYRYGNQGPIMFWNLANLGSCLVQLVEDEEKARHAIDSSLQHFQNLFLDIWRTGMSRKIGITAPSEKDPLLIQELLVIMEKQQADYTLTFRYLADNIESNTLSKRFTDIFPDPQPIRQWLQKWRRRLKQESLKGVDLKAAMDSINPAYIPRNHHIEKAIRDAETDCDFRAAHRLLKALSTPYIEKDDSLDLMTPPRPEERVLQTFCGT